MNLFVLIFLVICVASVTFTIEKYIKFKYGRASQKKLDLTEVTTQNKRLKGLLKNIYLCKDVSEVRLLIAEYDKEFDDF